MKTIIILPALLLTLLCGIEASFAQSIPQEARRHFDRGMAAVEMARTPADYEKAIAEFERAKSFAPNWADVYYNLGLIQEKAERYRDAIESLKQYLRLAPNASDAETVKSHINKLEYKTEQHIGENEALDIFASLHEQQWEIKGARCRFDVMAMRGFKRAGNKILFKKIHQTIDDSTGRVMTVDVLEVPTDLIGKKLNYQSEYIVYDSKRFRPPATAFQYYYTKVELEIMSRTRVKAKGTTTLSWDSSVLENCNYEYVKKIEEQ